MLSVKQSLAIIVFLFFIFLFLRFLKDLLFKPRKVPHRRRRRKKIPAKRKKIFLTPKTKSKADMKFNKLLTKFRREHKRKPTKNDLFRVVINASHLTVRYRKGRGGHWGRQKVRKYLLEKHKIVKNYRMR